MYRGYFNIYKLITTENAIHEKIKMYKEIGTVDLTVYELDNNEAEKQGINCKSKVYNAICYDEEIQEGMYIEIFNIKYRIAKKTSYRNQSVLTFYEYNK